MAPESPKFISDVDTVWRQIFEPRMLQEAVNVIGVAYPSQFIFQEKDGRRVESVVWKEESTVEACHKLGVEKAARDAAAKKLKRPDIADDEVPRYVGFFPAQVGRLRGTMQEDDYFCEPGVFEVEHEPENDVFAHSHVVLLDGFVEIMRARMVPRLGEKMASILDLKKARQHAVNMITTVVERGGLCRMPAP
ncbi:hypothetical protein [Stenotrophomonas sp. T8]|uniref:hypothetical protein n=1 Tax=Stenotrophomonas sp. T8 TaxID=3446365 RepID=UPI003F6E5B31